MPDVNEALMFVCIIALYCSFVFVKSVIFLSDYLRCDKGC